MAIATSDKTIETLVEAGVLNPGEIRRVDITLQPGHPPLVAVEYVARDESLAELGQTLRENGHTTHAIDKELNQ